MSFNTALLLSTTLVDVLTCDSGMNQTAHRLFRSVECEGAQGLIADSLTPRIQSGSTPNPVHHILLHDANVM